MLYAVVVVVVVVVHTSKGPLSVHRATFLVANLVLSSRCLIIIIFRFDSPSFNQRVAHHSSIILVFTLPGWGINATDGKRREGAFYVGPGVAGILGTQPPCEASAGSPEKGFNQPWIQFGRSDTDPLYAVSSFAVAPSSTNKLKLLFSEMNTGLMLGTDESMKLGIDYNGPATGYKIKLFNSDGTELVNGFNDLVKEELGELEDGFYRGDPRLFHMPGGKAGVFIERTGAFYELEEIEL